MEHLDHYFKEKFNQRPLEFKEEHWEAALELLEQKKRKRRFFFWLWGGLGFALLSIGGYLLYQSYDLKQPIQSFYIPMSGMEQATISTAEHFNDSFDSTKEVPVLDNALQAESIPSTQKKRTTPKRFIAPSNTVEINEEKTNAFNPKIVEKEHSDDFVKTSTGNKKRNERKLVKEKEKVSKTIDLEQGTTLPQANRWTNDPIESWKAGPLDLPLRMFIFPSKEEEKAPIQKSFRHWKWGFAADVMLYPYRNEANESVIGWRLGGVVQYRFSSEWSLASGLGYRLRTGQFSFAKQETIASYRFGKEEEQYLLLPNQLHYLDIPIEIRYTSGKHHIGTGVRLNYLLGIRGNLRTFSELETEPNLFNTNKVDQGWIVKNGFKNTPIDVLLSYQFQLSKRFVWNVQMNYTLGSVLDESYNPPFPLLLRESKPLLQIVIRH